ncbi:hypothetical protein CSA80_00805 [Candidatus Saccharibacteria bacterium]|nr:MAG: hypothetical protein CR973_02350 [Candidatus Saccharibacteria bacterium]PID99294.1 MAG: hypothetical protein CSA80_00805 [Candidatus Saccharibacteria bacterium]
MSIDPNSNKEVKEVPLGLQGFVGKIRDGATQEQTQAVLTVAAPLFLAEVAPGLRAEQAQTWKDWEDGVLKLFHPVLNSDPESLPDGIRFIRSDEPYIDAIGSCALGVMVNVGNDKVPAQTEIIVTLGYGGKTGKNVSEMVTDLRDILRGHKSEHMLSTYDVGSESPSELTPTNEKKLIAKIRECIAAEKMGAPIADIAEINVAFASLSGGTCRLTRPADGSPPDGLPYAETLVSTAMEQLSPEDQREILTSENPDEAAREAIEEAYKSAQGDYNRHAETLDYFFKLLVRSKAVGSLVAPQDSKPQDSTHEDPRPSDGPQDSYPQDAP